MCRGEDLKVRTLGHREPFCVRALSSPETMRWLVFSSVELKSQIIKLMKTLDSGGGAVSVHFSGSKEKNIL